MSYVRRPLVLQGNGLVFGFRSIYTLGPYWVDNLLSGRLQGRAKSQEMKRCISEARSKINAAFASSVSARLQRLGMATSISVKKIGKQRIADPAGNDLGDIDILAVHPKSKSVLAIEAKDFEIARTPAEMTHELKKLFEGKRPTIALHSKRVSWLERHLDAVLASFGISDARGHWRVIGAVVTSEPLITPLVSSSNLPVLAFDDLTLDAVLAPARTKHTSKRPGRS